MVAFSVEPKKSAVLMGFIGLMMYALAPVLEPLIGDAFSESVTWR